MTVATVRAGISTALRTVDKLRASDYMLDEITPPHAMFDFEVEPHMVFGRTDQAAHTLKFTVQVFVSRSSDVPSQKYLDLLRDPSTTTGVTYAIENDTTLDAACDFARVTSIGKVQIAEVGMVEYLMVPFEVEVVL